MGNSSLIIATNENFEQPVVTAFYSKTSSRLTTMLTGKKKMKLGDEFTALLHKTYLKPRGFTKARRTFSREHEGYVERYQLQGSAWNSPEMPWTFYLNCGIAFIGLPRREPDRNFPDTHASMRASLFTDSASVQYDITHANMDLNAQHVAESIEEVSKFFARRWLYLKESYLAKKYSLGFLEDAELNERIASDPRSETNRHLE